MSASNSQSNLHILAEILNRITLGIVVQATDGKILFANPEARRLLGETLDYMQGGFAFHPNWRPVNENGSEFDDSTHPVRAALRGDELPGEIVFGMPTIGSQEVRWIRVGAGPLARSKENKPLLVYTTYQDISTQKLALNQLELFKKDYYLPIENSPVPFVVLKPNYRVHFASPSLASFLKVPQSELVGKDFIRLAPEAEQASVRAMLERLYLPPHTSTYSQVFAVDGDQHWIDWSFKGIRDATGKLEMLVGCGYDITENKRIEDLLQGTNAVVENTMDGVMLTDADNRIISVNESFTRITGYQAKEVIGKKPSILSSGRNDEAFYQEMWKSLQSTGKWQGKLWDRRKNGEVYLQWLNIMMIPDRMGKPYQYIAVYSASIEGDRLDIEMRRMLHLDPLTKLPNRLLFNTRLEHAILQATHVNKQLGVLYIDVDRFKDINDSLGYQTGDQFLVELTNRFRAVLREVDTLSRVGGDEFILLIENIVSSDELTHVAYRIKDCLIKPFTLNGQEIFASVSIGISYYPKDGQTVDGLINSAVAATRRAKKGGRNTCQFYTSELNANAFERMVIISKLSRALEKEELFLYYQPIVHLATGRLAGVEALLRWHNPDLGSISPVRFVPLAEESGLIKPIGSWVLETACRQMQSWLTSGIDVGRVSVNIAQLQFQRTDFPASVKTALQRTGIDPWRLILEVTESSLMSDMEKSLEVFNQLRESGIRMAIDDFGTGYSSLAYLRSLPVDILKLDQSFITRLPVETGNLAITRAVIAMGKAMKMEVLAEGVETEIQRNILIDEGCQYGQGFYFGAPVQPEDIKLYSGIHKLDAV